MHLNLWSLQLTESITVLCCQICFLQDYLAIRYLLCRIRCGRFGRFFGDGAALRATCVSLCRTGRKSGRKFATVCVCECLPMYCWLLTNFQFACQQLELSVLVGGAVSRVALLLWAECWDCHTTLLPRSNIFTCSSSSSTVQVFLHVA